MKITLTKILFLFGCSTILIGCLKDEGFPIEPKIELISVQFYGSDTTTADSAWVVFGFTDGDGDLGTSDTSANCIIEYREKDGNGIKEYSNLDRRLTFPNLTPEAKNKAIKGEMHIVIEPAPIFDFTTDSLFQWKLHIIDRAGNVSNKVTTDFFDKKKLVFQ